MAPVKLEEIKAADTNIELAYKKLNIIIFVSTIEA